VYRTHFATCKSFYKEKSSELYLMHKPELHVKDCLNNVNVNKQLKILHVPCQCTLSLMNVSNNIQEIFKTNSSLYRNNRKKVIFSHQKISFYFCIRILNLLPHSLTFIKNERAEFILLKPAGHVMH